MSKLSLALLMAAAVLIVLAVIFEVPFAQGGSGVLMLAALAYAYVVAKREVELLTYAAKDREEGDEPQTDHAPVIEQVEQVEQARARRSGFGVRGLPERALA